MYMLFLKVRLFTVRIQNEQKCFKLNSPFPLKTKIERARAGHKHEQNNLKYKTTTLNNCVIKHKI